MHWLKYKESRQGLVMTLVFVLMLLLVWLFESQLRVLSEATRTYVISDESAGDYQADTVSEKSQSMDKRRYRTFLENVKKEGFLDQWLSENHQVNSSNADLSALDPAVMDSLLKLAEIAYANKDYPAVTIILQRLDIDALYQQDLLFKFAVSLSRQGRTEQALKHYQALVLRDANHQSGWLNLGLLYKRSGEYQLAAEAYSKAAEIAGGIKRGKALLGQAESLSAAGDFVTARPLFEKAIEHRPSHSLSWYRFAVARAEANDSHTEVVDTFVKAISLDPAKSYFSRRLAQYLLVQLDFETAVSVLRSQLKHTPKSVATREMLIWCYQLMGKKRSAVKQIKWLKKHYSHWKKSDAYMALNASDTIDAAASEATDEWDNSLRYAYLHLSEQDRQLMYKKQPQLQRLFQSLDDWKMLKDAGDKVTNAAYYAEQYPHSSRVAFELAQILTERQVFEQALKLMAHAITLNPERSRLYHYKSDILLAMGQTEAAVQWLDHSITVRPSAYRLHLARADILFAQGDFTQAVTAYEDVIRLSAESAELLYKRALSKTALNELVSAEADLRKALTIENGNVAARFTLAEVLCQQRKISVCRDELDRVIKLDPAHEKAKKLLEEADQENL